MTFCLNITTSNLSHSSKIRLLPAQAKNLELSIIWALKGTNYIDHFQQYTKSVLQDQSTNLSALQEWLKLKKAPSEVEALLTAAVDKATEVKQVLGESQEIFRNVVNSLIFQNSVVQLARRDDLSYLVSQDVPQHTRRNLRNSKFHTTDVFDETLCQKARSEYLDLVNRGLGSSRSRKPNRNNNNYNNNNQYSGNNGYNPRNQNQSRSSSYSKGGGFPYHGKKANKPFQNNANQQQRRPGRGGNTPKKSFQGRGGRFNGNDSNKKD